MYLTEMTWQGWHFYIPQEKQLFGKTRVEVIRGEIEEEFFIEEDYLSERICEKLYEEYLYIYG